MGDHRDDGGRAFRSAWMVLLPTDTGNAMTEVWLWEKTQEGTTLNVAKFDTKEEAETYAKENRGNRNCLYVEDNRTRGLAWNLIGAKCPM